MAVYDASILTELGEWFDEIFRDSTIISEVGLLQAEEVWKRRRLVSAPGIKVANGLLDTCRKSFTHPIWQRAKVTFWQDHPSQEAEEAFATLKTERSWGEEYSYYEDWQNKLHEGDWVFDFPMETPLKATFEHIWHILPYSADSPTLTLARKCKTFNPDAFGVIKMTDGDREQIAGIAKHFVQVAGDKRNAIVPLTEIVAYLDRAEVPTDSRKPTIAQFEAAMTNIYHEARASGYTASGFRRMLQEQGALSTARRLVLSPQPSPGFGELLLLNRLDLTVEALIVQEPWRRLFEPQVLNAARRRLDQFAKR